MPKINRLLGSMAFSPILWGVLATVLFYVPIRSGAWSNAWIDRLFAAHGAAQLVTGIFLIGIVTVLMKAAGIRSQRRLLTMALLDGIPPGGQPLAACDGLLDRLDAQPAAMRESYLVRRLRQALEYIYRKNSADTIEDEMRYLAALDRTCMHTSYGFLRRLTCATALVGAACAAVAAGDAVAARADFSGACDLLGLAAVLTAGLLFATHFVEQMEADLISAVDARVSAELVGRFELAFNPASDPQVAIVRRMAEQLMKSTEQSVERQAELWKTSFAETQKQWNEWSAGATGQLRESLATTMQDHAATLAAAAKAASEQNSITWNEVQQALLQNAEAVTLQQRELTKQGEVLTQIIAATGQVEKLEAELNRNLSTLAGAKNFEQTVLSLGAAIQLLNSKLGAVPTPETPQVQLKAKRAGNKAA